MLEKKKGGPKRGPSASKVEWETGARLPWQQQEKENKTKTGCPSGHEPAGHHWIANLSNSESALRSWGCGNKEAVGQNSGKGNYPVLQNHFWTRAGQAEKVKSGRTYGFVNSWEETIV